MADWLDENIEPNDYESFEDYASAIQNEFGVNSEIARALAKPFWEEFLEDLAEQTSLEDFVEPEPEKPKPKEKPKEVKLTENQKNDIKNVIQNEDLTKREQSIQTMKLAWYNLPLEENLAKLLKEVKLNVFLGEFIVNYEMFQMWHNH